MTIRILFCLLFALAAASGCRLIYKQNIQQGNALEDDELDELYIGMNRRQVLFVLGTPSIRDPFHQDRWDYVQTFSRRGGKMVQKTVTLRFEDDDLVEIIGHEEPFAPSSESSGEVASFVKKPEASPQEAAVESVKEEVLAAEPDIQAVEERTAEERDLDRAPDPLDQTPDEGAPSPDIDG